MMMITRVTKQNSKPQTMNRSVITDKWNDWTH